MAKIKYFCGTVELMAPHGLSNTKFSAIGGVKSKHNAYDGYARLVGHPVIGPDAIMPVTRKIEYKSNPSLHKCGAKCRNAAGHICECECGGEFHGAGD